MKKLIPSKTPNYASLIEENAFYVDKTQFIQTLESISDKYLFFLRPRRFGKSLTISMLEHYYGIQHKDKFERLFGEYFIGQQGNVTPLKNSYYVLNFSFSGIKTQSSKEVETEFNSEVSTQLIRFLNRYSLGTDGDQEQLMGDISSPDLLRRFFTLFNKYAPSGKIYILVDEYDHFTNELFSFDREYFKEIVSRNGWVRKFYEVIKQFMGEGIVDRFFATGVTPVTLDSMTSGFNVAQNITLDGKFHNMAGFTESELRSMLENTIYEEGKFDLETVISDMRSWYNGSKFSEEATERLYNPQMVVSFLTRFAEKYRYPKTMADHNVTSDYTKIANILAPLQKEDADHIISTVLDTDRITERLTIQYNFELLYTKTEAISLLFYNGLLTIEDSVVSSYKYVIPNYVIKQMYWEFFRYKFTTEKKIKYDYTLIDDSIEEMFFEGKIDKLVAYVHSIIKNLSNRDFQNFSEKNIKMIFMTLFMGSNAYFVKSEQENKEGYTDLLLIPTKINPGKDSFLLELKYLKKSSKSTLETEKIKAVEQAKRYKNELAAEGIECKTFAILFVGKSELAIAEVV